MGMFSKSKESPNQSSSRMVEGTRKASAKKRRSRSISLTSLKATAQIRLALTIRLLQTGNPVNEHIFQAQGPSFNFDAGKELGKLGAFRFRMERK